ncbi:class II glutamine amidotransferase [bacterium]|nr:class II glutamine amidotransferase [bacterium]
MCRFLAYHGKKALLADFVYNCENSLVKQSYNAKESRLAVNADGFGIGWYTPEIDEQPCVLTSILPAWSSRNLKNISQKTISECFFAHIRAASPGTTVDLNNCHPFYSGKLMFMHNGAISNFLKVKRELQNELSAERFEKILGNTDSELIFSLFLDKLQNENNPTKQDLINAMLQTIQKIVETQNGSPCHFNFALTDGKNLLATRFCSDKNAVPVSLYYTFPEKIFVEKDLLHLICGEKKEAVLISSEPLTQDEKVWTSFPPNSMLFVEENLDFELLPIKI